MEPVSITKTIDIKESVRTQVADTVHNVIDDLKAEIERLKQPRYQSGYLRSKFG